MIPITKEQVVIALVNAVKKDQANRYTLIKDWTLPRLNVIVPDYTSALFDIRDCVITIKAYTGDVCNGCTLSPDKIGSWRPLIGALFHDPWYGEIAALAKAWNWPEAIVRKLGDEIFANILIATGTPRWLARGYFTGVRRFGWLARIFKLSIGVVILSSAAGCAGCMDIPDRFDSKPVPQPQYEETTNA